MTRIALIAAVGQNGVIGDAGNIPWRLPSDFAWFKRQTMGKPLIMGRKTFESIGKPLAGRTNIIVTRSPAFAPEGVTVAFDLRAALSIARRIAEADGVDEIMIGGGGQIYAAAMPLADRLYVTHVDLAPEGDTRFPDIDPVEWAVIENVPVEVTTRDSASFRVVLYERRGSAAH